MAKKKFTAFKKSLIPAVSLLFVLLTIFTSCTARQWLKSIADVELNKTFNANKSKSATFEACTDFLEKTKTKNEVHSAKISPAVTVFFLFFIGCFFPARKTTTYFYLPVPLTDRPLYMLYNKRKILD